MRLMGIHMPLSSSAWNIIEVSGSTEWKMGFMYTHAFAGFITRTSNYLRMPDEPISPEEALKALDILSAQIGNARLRKLWKAPIQKFIKQYQSRK